MSIRSLELHCDYVSKRSVHCKKYTNLDIGLDKTAREVIEDSHWALVDGKVLCDEHL